MAPSGLYARLCHAFLVLFTSLFIIMLPFSVVNKDYHKSSGLMFPGH